MMSDFSLKESYKYSLNIILFPLSGRWSKKESVWGHREFKSVLFLLTQFVICSWWSIWHYIDLELRDQLEVKGHSQCDVTKDSHGSYYWQKSKFICIIIYCHYKVNIIKYNENVFNGKSISLNEKWNWKLHVPKLFIKHKCEKQNW